MQNPKKRKSKLMSRFALIYFACLMVSIFLLSALYHEPNNNNNRKKTEPENDSIKIRNLNSNNTNSTKKKKKHHHHRYYSYSCNEIYQHITHDGEGIRYWAKLCKYAKTCNDGDGIFASEIYFCNEIFPKSSNYTESSDIFFSDRFAEKIDFHKLKLYLLQPIFMIYLLLLFRTVASTAEDYFTPSLEMFSVKLGLPPRFAGVTLLALGNSAPDIADSINCIKNDVLSGYLMAVGELIGVCMFDCSICVAVVLFATSAVTTTIKGKNLFEIIMNHYKSIQNEYYPCQGAFYREIIAFLVTISVLWFQFGYFHSVDYFFLKFCIGFYFFYVALVLVADVSHRVNCKNRRCQSRSQLSESTKLLSHPSKNQQEENQCSNIVHQALEAISNYNDDGSEWKPQKEGCLSEKNERLETKNYQYIDNAQSLIEEHIDSCYQEVEGEESIVVVHIHHGSVHTLSCKESHCVTRCSSSSDETSVFFGRILYDVQHECQHILHDISQNNFFERAFMYLELPIIILRKLTIPIPCSGVYNRTFVSLSTILSTIWLQYYFQDQYSINYYHVMDSFIPYGIIVISTIFALYVFVVGMNYEHLSPIVTVIIALYGFVVAATWIDFLADFLVDVLTFFGIIYHIPGSIMGLTILAWGNSFADLAANVVVAKKGLTDMAITACFAGPVFDVLIGVALGFFALMNSLETDQVFVHLTPSLYVGLALSIITCLFLISSGILSQGKIPIKFGYLAIIIFVVYTGIALAVSEKKFNP